MNRMRAGEWSPIAVFLLGLLLGSSSLFHGQGIYADEPATVPEATVSAPCSGSDLQGTVFNDFNADGLLSSGNTESGILGAVITVFSGDGSSATCESLADGSFGIDAPTGGFPVRLEARLPVGSAWDSLEPGAAGTTTVLFADTPSTGLNIGFNAPLDYCQANPDVLTTCFLQGDPLFAGSDFADGDAIVSVDYERTQPSPTHLAVGSEVGPVWGAAYQRSSQSLFTSAVLRRHSGLGPLGLGGIYRVDFSGGGTPTVSSFVDLATLGVAVGTDPRTQPGENPPGSGPTGNEPGLDNLAYEEIGKVGIGDIEIEESAGRLWAMSLADRTLYAMDIGAAGNVPSTAGAFPLPAVSCTDGVFRPWALKSYRGRIYIGGVCSNETISPYPTPGGFISFPNLVGYVYSMDPADGVFSQELTIPLSYPKGCAGGAAGCQWYPWTDLSTASVVATPTFPSHPTPILSDIEFADDGDMIIGLNDRTGFQYGSASPLPNGMPTDTTVATAFVGGDMLRADYDVATDSFVLESNGIVGGVVGAGSGNAQGPGGGEYYSASTAGFHFELSQGGYAVLRGSNEFVGSAMDPVTTNSGRLLWMHEKGATPGAKLAGYTLFDITTPSGFRKSAAVGDLELRCDEAPIEIGNRVWCDASAADTPNGIQDPVGAAGIPDVDLAGITVDLDCGGGTITASTTTDAQGRYLFSAANVAGGIPKLTSCTISIDTGSAGNSPILGACVQPTLLDVGNSSDPGQDLRDSDAVDLGGGVVGAMITTGGPGANNHTLDFGFRAPADSDISITKTDGVGAAVPGETVTYTLVAGNAGPAADPSVNVTDIFPASLSCTYTSVAAGGAAGNSSGSGNLTDTLTMPAGSSVTYTVDCTIDASATGVLTNTATASGSLPDPMTANNTATDSTTLVPEADLSISKTDSATTAVPGQSVIYTIVAANAGPSDDPAVVVTDNFPAGLTCSYTSVAAGGASGNTSGSGDLADTLSIPAAGSVTYTVDCLIDPAATGTLSNTATITGSVDDPNAANDSATDGDTVLAPEADLTVVKTDSIDPVSFGQSLIYTITVTNNGASQAESVTVIDSLPVEVTFISAGGTDWSCTESVGVVTCELATLAPGEAPPILLEVMAPMTLTTVTNLVEVSSTATDPNLADNAWSEDTAVMGSVVEVPAVGPGGLVLLTLLLVGGAVFTLRRRLS